jgi:hypothetical protein
MKNKYVQTRVVIFIDDQALVARRQNLALNNLRRIAPPLHYLASVDYVAG